MVKYSGEAATAGLASLAEVARPRNVVLEANESICVEVVGRIVEYKREVDFGDRRDFFY